MTIDFEKRAIERMLEAGISLGHIQSQKEIFSRIPTWKIITIK